MTMLLYCNILLSVGGAKCDVTGGRNADKSIPLLGSLAFIILSMQQPQVGQSSCFAICPAVECLE